MMLMRFSLRKTPQCLIQAEKIAHKNISSIYVDDYEQLNSEDEVALVQKKTSSDGPALQSDYTKAL
jgi:hypothetical protein